MKSISPITILTLSAIFPTSLGFTQVLRSTRLALLQSTAISSTSAINFERRTIHKSSSTSLNMVRLRGLERREEGATPLSGGMTVYIKAAEDGTSAGDCPFAHYVRMVLHEKSLPYDLQPSTQETKPDWLIDHYDGKMPALRHRKECYVESDVIAQYLDFFFEEPKLSPYSKKAMEEAGECTDGFFPAVARYLKSTENGSESDLGLKENLETALGKLEAQLAGEGKTGPFLAADGEQFTLLDCSLAPKLYHMSVGLNAFKENAIDVETSFPNVKAYMDAVFDRDSFKDALYPEETVIWGWSSARN
jgi:glutathione S-transferase